MQVNLLSAVVATGAGTPYQIERGRYSFIVNSTGVTTGATIAIQTKLSDGTWINVDSRNYTVTGSVVLNYNGPLNWIRANVTSWTDGTHTVDCIAV